MSKLALLFNLAAVGVFGYSVYFMNFDQNLKKMSSLIPEPLHKYGHFKFLTYQCLLIQLLNALLHVLAHFVRALEKPRDVVFTALAYPVGSLVVYTFWGVWFSMGREFIFPKELSQFYPDWLNHATHSVIAPLNIVVALLVNHKYRGSGLMLTVLYTGLYTLFLHYIKFESGVFVYRYLDVMSDRQRIAYFAATGLLAHLMYKSGEYLNSIVHGGARPAPKVSKKQKQK